MRAGGLGLEDLRLCPDGVPPLRCELRLCPDGVPPLRCELRGLLKAPNLCIILRPTLRNGLPRGVCAARETVVAADLGETKP